MRGLVDGARLAVSFLTVLPVGARRVDRETAGVAMALAPLVGALLGGLAAAVCLGAAALGTAPLLAAVLAVATLAALTRGLHLDGLADTADGLGSGRPAAHALEVMKRSDIGPFGVVVLVLVLLAQAAAIAQAVSTGTAASGLVLAAATGRTAVLLAARRGVPAARPQGLGALVASSVPMPTAWVGAAGLLAAAAVLGALDGASPAAALLGVSAGLGAAFALERHAVRRLGGVTGDVFGALVETGTTVALVVLAVVAAG